MQDLASRFSTEGEVLIKSLIALGQAEALFLDGNREVFSEEAICSFVEELLPVERFYKEIGGVVGYHSLVLKHLYRDSAKQGVGFCATEGRPEYLRPEGIDLSLPTEDVRESILAGIFSLPMIAEMYPVGGAADRLGLYDPVTGVPMPAALLSFCGKTLLEWLIHDLQAREYLYFKLTGENIKAPIAMMTSWEKDNHRQIIS
ncbi:MAG: hypothetical protein HYZ48_03540, partial [Chlamydiales bacterium]|nr:hypothetical protein [Chlamydiales bacterium]